MTAAEMVERYFRTWRGRYELFEARLWEGFFRVAVAAVRWARRDD